MKNNLSDLNGVQVKVRFTEIAPSSSFWHNIGRTTMWTWASSLSVVPRSINLRDYAHLTLAGMCGGHLQHHTGDSVHCPHILDDWKADKFFYFLFFITASFNYFTLFGMMLVACTPSALLANILITFADLPYPSGTSLLDSSSSDRWACNWDLPG